MTTRSPGWKPRSRKRPEQAAVPAGWVEVATAPDLMSAGMLEGMLRAEDIPVMLNRPGVFPLLGSGGVHGVMVPEDRAADARKLLEGVWDLKEEGDK